MSDTSFAFADSQLRALEPALLTKTQLEGLLAAGDVNAAMETLVSSGWQAADDIDTLIAKANEDLWQTVREHVENTLYEGFITCKNDFHNLKVAIKSLILSKPPVGYAAPTLLECDGLVEALGKKEYESLPDFLQMPAQEAYAVATLSGDGQQIDSLLDKYTLLRLQELAAKSENAFIAEYTELFCVQADIKIALRALKANKPKAFIEEALVPTKTVSVPQMAAAAQSEEALFTYIEQIGYQKYVDALQTSLSQFEKQCDDDLMALVKATKLIAFGPEQILAYYFARESEIKNVRILLACKASGADAVTAAERMRDLYV